MNQARQWAFLLLLLGVAVLTLLTLGLRVLPLTIMLLVIPMAIGVIILGVMTLVGGKQKDLL